MNVVEEVLGFRPQEYRFDGKVLECWEDGIKMWELRKTAETAMPIFHILMMSHTINRLHYLRVRWAEGRVKGKPKRPDVLREFVEAAYEQVMDEKPAEESSLVSQVHRRASIEIKRAMAKDVDLLDMLANKREPVSIRYVRNIVNERTRSVEGFDDRSLTRSLNQSRTLRKRRK